MFLQVGWPVVPLFLSLQQVLLMHQHFLEVLRLWFLRQCYHWCLVLRTILLQLRLLSVECPLPLPAKPPPGVGSPP